MWDISQADFVLYFSKIVTDSTFKLFMPLPPSLFVEETCDTLCQPVRSCWFETTMERSHTDSGAPFVRFLGSCSCSLLCILEWNIYPWWRRLQEPGESGSTTWAVSSCDFVICCQKKSCIKQEDVKHPLRHQRKMGGTLALALRVIICMTPAQSLGAVR